MANSPIVYQLHEGRATGNEATAGGAIGQSAHCVSNPGGVEVIHNGGNGLEPPGSPKRSLCGKSIESVPSS